jgi:hypothetical protein
LELDSVRIDPHFFPILDKLRVGIHASVEGRIMVLNNVRAWPRSGSPEVPNRVLQSEFEALNRLTFAVLDDNKLIRVNVEHILKRSFPLSTITSSGETVQDCLVFPLEILCNQVDIALVDLNLDYEDALLKGNDVARQCLGLGFRGCLVLHTSDTCIPDAEMFHGLVEKTADKTKFLRGVLGAWQAFQLTQSAFPATSSEPSLADDQSGEGVH